jgi:hypothetical protein
MTQLESVALKTSALAVDIVKLTPFEIGYLAGVLVENNHTLAREFMIALELNLDEVGR